MRVVRRRSGSAPCCSAWALPQKTRPRGRCVLLLLRGARIIYFAFLATRRRSPPKVPALTVLSHVACTQVRLAALRLAMAFVTHHTHLLLLTSPPSSGAAAAGAEEPQPIGHGGGTDGAVVAAVTGAVADAVAQRLRRARARAAARACATWAPSGDSLGTAAAAAAAAAEAAAATTDAKKEKDEDGDKGKPSCDSVSLAFADDGSGTCTLLRGMLALCLGALTDPQPEVTEAARYALSGVVSTVMGAAGGEEEVEEVAVGVAVADSDDALVPSGPGLRALAGALLNFTRDGAGPKSRRRLKRMAAAAATATAAAAAADAADAAVADAEVACDRHKKAEAKSRWQETTGSLGLAAVVGAFPFTLPSVMPETLVSAAAPCCDSSGPARPRLLPPRSAPHTHAHSHTLTHTTTFSHAALC